MKRLIGALLLLVCCAVPMSAAAFGAHYTAGDGGGFNWPGGWPRGWARLVAD